VPAARVTDITDVLIGDLPIETTVIGIRPGEKVHEILVSEEEAHRTIERGQYYVILPMLPELRSSMKVHSPRDKEYSSADSVMTKLELYEMLRKHNLLLESGTTFQEEILA
jgi:UDP-glucose 4-epimerase